MEIDNFLPGSASLVEMVDKKLVLSLRDGRHLYGILRSYDQFVLQDSLERIFLMERKEYFDLKAGNGGLYLVRGENVVLVGECCEQEDEAGLDIPAPAGYSLFMGDSSTESGKSLQKEALAIWNEERKERKMRERMRNLELHKIGFSTEVIDGDLY